MGLDASKAKGGAPRTPPLETGIYNARLVQAVDLGLQPRSYQGEDKDPTQEIMLTYELVGEFLLDEDGEPQPDKPRWVSENFSLHPLSSEKAKSTKRLKVLDPSNKTGGNFALLMGTPVIVSIIQNPSKKDPTKIYAKISDLIVMRAPDAGKLPQLVNSPRLFDLDEPNKEVFDGLPDWVKAKIRTNLEWKGSKAEAILGNASKEAKGKPAEDKEEDGTPY